MEQKVKIVGNKMRVIAKSLADIYTHGYSRKKEIRIRGKPP